MPADDLLHVEQWAADGSVNRTVDVSAFYTDDGTSHLSVTERHDDRGVHTITLPGEVWVAVLDAFVEWLEEHHG
jgi:hypothetical protein